MISVKHLKKVYNEGKENEYMALQDISMQIQEGEIVAVIGKSGAGKSTLMHILACMDTFNEGEYYLDKIEIQGISDKQSAQIRNERIGIVMQDFALVEEFTALENVLLPLDFSKEKKKGKEQTAMEALEDVEMEDFAYQRVDSMSGGQKQRVAIARAIANNPDIILADEPTGALDSGTSEKIIELFKRLNREGKTVVLITHDLEVARGCDKMFEIKDGCITI